MRRMFASALSALAYLLPVYTLAHAAEMQCLPAADGIERVMQMAQMTQGRVVVFDTEASAAFITYIRVQLPMYEITGTDVIYVDTANGFTAAFVLNVPAKKLCAMDVEPHHLAAAKDYAGGLKA